MSAKSERHNTITNDAVMNLFGPIIKAGGDYTETCIVLESIAFGAAALMVKVHGLTPQVAAGLMEAAINRAIERFAANNPATPSHPEGREGT
jgi:hypothetical protein